MNITNNQQAKQLNSIEQMRWNYKIHQGLKRPSMTPSAWRPIMTDQPVGKEFMVRPVERRAERYLMRMRKLLLALVILGLVLFLNFVIWINALLRFVMIGETLQGSVEPLILAGVCLVSLLLLVRVLLKSNIELNKR